MNTRAINSAAGVIQAAITQGRVPAGIATALDAAGLLNSPERAAELESTPIEVYRAEQPDAGIVLGHYGTAAGARAHCEAMLRRELPTVSVDWIEDEEDGIAELVAAIGEDERPTGYIVTALELASAYDEGADE